MDQTDFTVPEPLDFAPCSICGRTFNPEILPRHERICNKSQRNADKRKPFDTAKHRLAGTEIEAFMKATRRGGRPSTSEQKAAAAKKKSDWRRKHDTFIQSIRAARTVTEAVKSGAPLPPYQPSAPDPDYVECPHCQRRFQESAAERHIPFCKEMTSRINRKASSKAKDSLSKRMQYKPPMPRKHSSTNQGETRAPPGASVVTRNTNFSGTYTVGGAQPADGVAGGYPTRAGSIPRTNTRVRTRQPSGPAAMMVAPRTTTKGVVNGILRAESFPGDTPGTHKHPQPPSGPAPAIRRQTSFSRRGGNASGPETQVTTDQTAFGKKPQFGVGGGSGTRVPSVSTTGGIVVRNSTSRRLYEYSSDEQEGAGRHNGDIPNGHTHDVDARTADLRRSRRGTGGKGRFASSGGSERSSSPHSDVDHQHAQQQLVATQIRRAPESRGRQHYPLTSADPFTHRRLSRNCSSDSHGRERIGSDSSQGSIPGSNRGVPLNAHGMTMSKYCYECGTKFPVPQAKYCCECGTKRI